MFNAGGLLRKRSYKCPYQRGKLTAERSSFVLEQSGDKEGVRRQLDRSNLAAEVMCGRAKAVPKQKSLKLAIETIAAMIALGDPRFSVRRSDQSSILQQNFLALFH